MEFPAVIDPLLWRAVAARECMPVCRFDPAHLKPLSSWEHGFPAVRVRTVPRYPCESRMNFTRSFQWHDARSRAMSHLDQALVMR
jgi:hypothetical protein